MRLGSDRSTGFACTVISFVPFPITEEKPGLIPGRFSIPAASDLEPRVLHVKRSLHYVYLDETRGSLQVRDAADEVARSIVEDFSNAQLGVRDDAGPALMWVEGEKSWSEIKVLYASEVEAALARQRRWFVNLCRIADDDWNRYQRHNVISDFQRIAARVIGLNPEQHPWMDLAVQPNAKLCPSCASQIGDSVICPNCKVVLKPEEFKNLQYAT